MGEIIGLFVFVGVVLAFMRYKLDMNPVGWLWDHIVAGWKRISK